MQCKKCIDHLFYNLSHEWKLGALVTANKHEKDMKTFKYFLKFVRTEIEKPRGVQESPLNSLSIQLLIRISTGSETAYILLKDITVGKLTLS